MSNAETGLTKAIKEALALNPDVIVTRAHSGKVKVRGGWMQLADEGTSDLLCCVRALVDVELRPTRDYSLAAVYKFTARFCALEVKTPDGTTSKGREAKQGEFLRRVRSLGGFGARVRSVDEARAAIERCKRGESE